MAPHSRTGVWRLKSSCIIVDCFVYCFYHLEVNNVRNELWRMVWEVAVTKELEVDRENASKNQRFLPKQWEDCAQFYQEMVLEKVAGVMWSNPMCHHCPSTTNANGKLCNIIVALNELRTIAAHVRNEPEEFSEEFMMFGAHVLDWLAPDK